MLALKTVLLIRIVIVGLVLRRMSLALDLSLLLFLLELLLVHLLKLMNRHLQIRHKSITATSAEILTNHNTHHLQILGLWSHGVSWNDPAARSKLVGDSKFVELVFVVRVQAESHEWQTLAAGLGHEKEAHILYRRCEVVRCLCKVVHDRSVSLLAEPDQLVVLSNDLTSATGEVECERGLVSSKVVCICISNMIGAFHN